MKVFAIYLPRLYVHVMQVDCIVSKCWCCYTSCTIIPAKWKWVENCHYRSVCISNYLFNWNNLNFELGNEIVGTACQRSTFAWLLCWKRADICHFGICQLWEVTNLSTKFTSWTVSFWMFKLWKILSFKGMIKKTHSVKISNNWVKLSN